MGEFIETVRRYPNPRMNMHAKANSFMSKIDPYKAVKGNLDTRSVYPELKRYDPDREIEAMKKQNLER